MNEEYVQKAVALGREVNHIFVATADARGMPHVAAAGRMGYPSEGRVTVAAWFCPGTVRNLEHNRHVSIVVWDPDSDTGYQLLGEVEKVEDLAMLDGFTQGAECISVPQVERQLFIRVDEAVSFKHAPHSDFEERVPVESCPPQV